MTDNIHNYGYRAPRYCADFHLLLQTLNPSPMILDAHCTSLSEDGLAAEVNASLEIGTNLTIIMTLPGSPRSLRVSARVTNLQADGYGFAFVFGDDEMKRYLRNYLESNSSSMVRSPYSTD